MLVLLNSLSVISGVRVSFVASMEWRKSSLDILLSLQQQQSVNIHYCCGQIYGHDSDLGALVTRFRLTGIQMLFNILFYDVLY